MLRNNLLESEYQFVEKGAREGVISIMWVSFTVLFTAAALIFFFLFFDELNAAPIFGDVTGLILILMLFIYLALKFFATFLFCQDKYNSIKLTMLERKWIPICFCREAFRPWQIILMYLIPLVIAHAGIILVGIFTFAGPIFAVLLFFMEFFMALDLALVIYVIYIKLKYKPDYISVNHHVYNMTLYTRAYIRDIKRKRRK